MRRLLQSIEGKQWQPGICFFVRAFPISLAIVCRRLIDRLHVGLSLQSVPCCLVFDGFVLRRLFKRLPCPKVKRKVSDSDIEWLSHTHTHTLIQNRFPPLYLAVPFFTCNKGNALSCHGSSPESASLNLACSSLLFL